MEWKQTPLSKFGYKCIANKHDDCVDDKCECLCHDGKGEVSVGD